MQAELYYTVYSLDEDTLNYVLLYSTKSLYSAIDYYNRLKRLNTKKFLKLCKDLCINEDFIPC